MTLDKPFDSQAPDFNIFNVLTRSHLSSTPFLLPRVMGWLPHWAVRPPALSVCPVLFRYPVLGDQ